MADEAAEYELRCRAVRLRQQGMPFAQVLAAVGRGRVWLSKWLQRFREAGWVGLHARTRAPKRRPKSMSARVVAKVLALRAELQAHPSVPI